ncbi:hypothetical protein ACOI1H_22280 [Loktanella sp. DJP18]|uniref:hypothetical protein n=1 Tax=Loktanella sp. DJP18 TaxID=3409788 RepID=UPI003BB61F66
MNKTQLLSKSHWRHFDHLPELSDQSLICLAAMDAFLDYVAARGLANPGCGDIVQWACTEDDALSAVQHLKTALKICVPSFVDAAQLAIKAIQKDSQRPDNHEHLGLTGHESAVTSPSQEDRGSWNPLERPAAHYAKRRKVSIYPDELPPDWKDALVRAALGLPGNGVVISHEILKRTREKLCQLGWSCRKAGIQIDISRATIEQFQRDVTDRCKIGKNGLRWATIRASVEELHRFARFLGLDPVLIQFLSERLAILDSRERCQKALKHFELARTGNTTNKILDMADGLLEAMCAVDCPQKRHRMRNRACILGVYPIAPLRNASAYLIFGKNLFWINGEWVIDMMVQKTHATTPYNLVLPLAQDHGKFIDAVLLGDHPSQRLGERRSKAMATRRPLFVLSDGTPVSPTYIPRIFKALTGNSFTTTRTMLHTDEAIEHGDAGTSYAMIASHQTDWDIRTTYQQDRLARTAVNRRQAARRSRRAEFLAGETDLRADDDFRTGLSCFSKGAGNSGLS